MIDPDAAYAPIALGVVLVALIGLLVLRAIRKDRREYGRFKRYRSTVKRQRMYRKWLVDSFVTFGGASLVVLALTWQYVPLVLDAVNSVGWVRSLRSAFADSGGVGVGLVIGAVVVLVGGTLIAITLARNTESVVAIGDVQSLLPRNRAELGYGAALSVNAGIVEELLFRLALPALVFGVTGNVVVAIVASLVLFGVLHVYQGVAGIVGSTIIGALLMVVFLATGSIVAAIVVHALIDLRSLVAIPMLVYRVHRVAGDVDAAPGEIPVPGSRRAE